MTPSAKSRHAKSRVPHPPTAPMPADDRDAAVLADEIALASDELSARMYDASVTAKVKALPHLIEIRDRLGDIFRSL